MTGTAHFGSAEEADWLPPDDAGDDSRLWELVTRMECTTVDQLHRAAIEQPDRYWAHVIAQFGLRFRQPYDALCDLSAGKPFPHWFRGGLMNIVDTCLARDTEAAETAVVSVDENGERHELSRAEFVEQVEALAGFLHARGVRAGDCVALFTPLVPRATVAFFACAWIGAVAVPVFSGFGPTALATRLRDCAASTVISVAAFQRKGIRVDLAAVVAAAMPDCETVKTILALDDLSVAGWTNWSDAIHGSARVPVSVLDPNHPLMILYTSGTTGQPKGVVHSHAGFLTKAVSDFGLAFELRPQDRLLWITDIGWLIAPMVMVASAAIGATAVHFVGAPDHPDVDRLWRLAAAEEITVLGLSPSAARRCAALGDSSPARAHDLARLRTVLSTGEPWDTATWQWVFTEVASGRVPILNYTGGTEVGGGLLTDYAALPVRACSFAGPVIGVDVDVVSREGAPVLDSIGELVVRNVWPGMTHGFWGASQGRYLETYWSQLPETWWHGDLARHETGGWWTVEGRADDTMKIAGRRVGPGEIEAVLLAHPMVGEAAVIAVPDPDRGQVIVAFVVAVDGLADEAALIDHVASRLGRSLTPARLVGVPALPRTRSGKVVRRAIRAAYLGEEQGDLSGLDDLSTLEVIPRLAQLGRADGKFG